MPEIPRQFSPIELWVQTVLRVPPYPEPPEGSPESIQVFRAGRKYYTLCLLGWFLTNLFVLFGLIGAQFIVNLSFMKMPEWARITWRIAEWLALFAFAASVSIHVLLPASELRASLVHRYGS